MIIVESASKDQQPIGCIMTSLTKTIAQLCHPYRPLLRSGKFGDSIGSFPQRRYNGRDLLKRVVARPFKNCRTPGTSSIKHAMPIAGDRHGNCINIRITAAEGVV